MAQEKKIENLIKRFLTTRRINGDRVFFYKQFQTGATPDGLPDIVCCIGGRFVGIEVKAPSGKISTVQKIIARNIITANGVAIFCDDILMFRDWYGKFVLTPFAPIGQPINLTGQDLVMEDIDGE